MSLSIYMIMVGHNDTQPYKNKKDIEFPNEYYCSRSSSPATISVNSSTNLSLFSPAQIKS